MIARAPHLSNQERSFVCADDRGSLLRVHASGQRVDVQASVQVGSVVRDLCWHHTGRVYALLENRKLLLLDAVSLAVVDTLEGFSSCIAVSPSGEVIGGRWNENRVRAACFLNAGDDHVLVDANGSVTVVRAGSQISFSPQPAARGDIESYVFDAPQRQHFVLVQAALSDGRGFVDADIFEVSYDGALQRRSRQALASIRAVTATQDTTVCYGREGLIDVGHGSVLKQASGYPLTALMPVASQSLAFFGVRSDNSLAFLDVT